MKTVPPLKKAKNSLLLSKIRANKSLFLPKMAIRRQVLPKRSPFLFKIRYSLKSFLSKRQRSRLLLSKRVSRASIVQNKTAAPPQPTNGKAVAQIIPGKNETPVVPPQPVTWVLLNVAVQCRDHVL